MNQLFIICACGLPNPIQGLDPGLLSVLKTSSSKYFCSTCGEQLTNGAAFVGEWDKMPDGHFEVREKSK
jgi:hypothetical protein